MVRVTAADTLILSGSSTSSAGTFPSGIFASALGLEAGAGNAGSVVVEAPRVALTAGAAIDSVTVVGRGGDIAILAEQVRLTAGAVISAQSSGEGNAGSITLTARDTFLSQHSTVSTGASQATGGNIRLTASSLVRLQDSQMTAAVGGGTGDGGNVTIDPAFLVLQGSQITANAFAGRGGRVSLTASQALLADPSSTVTASSTLGLSGEVDIQAPVTNISSTLVPLPQAFAKDTALVSTRCAERLRAGTVSTLVVRGRDGVPGRPGEVVPLPLGLAPLESATAVGTAGPPEDTPASHAGVLHIDAHGQTRVRGWPGQDVGLVGLALECTK
jgi:large exoprotein involved in heme utilization and adhesion